MTTDSPQGDRIAKRLARSGVASRRDAEEMIRAGRVKVNGKLIDSPALNVRESDKIEVDGRVLARAEAARLWLYHKPVGLVTTAKDEKGRETVFDKLPEGMPRVMSIGRLDLTSEGLLLLTNDGEIKRRLELPSTGWQRRYRVRVNGSPDDSRVEPLRKGIVIEGERFQAMEVKIDRQQGANAWLTVGIREGKNREIRRAMEHVGLKVNRLIRVSYGPFQLGDLAAGAVEEVKARILRDQLGLDAPTTPDEKPKRAPHAGGTPQPRVDRRTGEKSAGKPDRPRGTAIPKPGPKPDRTIAKPGGRGPKPAATDRPVAKPRKGPPKGRKV